MRSCGYGSQQESKHNHIFPNKSAKTPFVWKDHIIFGHDLRVTTRPLPTPLPLPIENVVGDRYGRFIPAA